MYLRPAWASLPLKPPKRSTPPSPSSSPSPGPARDAASLRASLAGRTFSEVALLDDGRRDNGRAGDGVFGTLVSRTSEAGQYQVKVHARCAAESADVAVEREALVGAYLIAGPDTDLDGIPDQWEALRGMNPSDASDALVDADHDGLIGTAEYEANTDPFDSDSDHGGLSDASEVEAGLDPSDPLDDAFPRSALELTECDGAVLVSFGARTDGIALQVERGPTADGPFTTDLPYTGRGVTRILDSDVTNGVQVCYRSRLLIGSLRSGWSQVQCAVPRADAFPPSVRVVQAPQSSHTREVALELEAEDGPGQPEAAMQSLACLSTPSGVKEVRVSSTSEFSGAPWQPFSRVVHARGSNADQIELWVQVRDGAGNESLPVAIRVTRSRTTRLDNAIALEELAQDLLESGDAEAAGARVHQSIGVIWQGLTAVHQRVAKSKKGPSPNDLHLLHELGMVHAEKHVVAGLLHGKRTRHAAKLRLDAVLRRERDLAMWADDHGIAP